MKPEEHLRRTTRSRASHREPVVRREDAMPEVAKKVLTVHFRGMLRSENGTRNGADLEKLHDMRVSVRRMRTAARILGRFLDVDEFQPFVREMQSLGRTLGPARDRDVMLDHLRRYQESVTLRERLDLDGLRQDWEDERRRMQRRILQHLDSSRYGRFTKDFPQFLSDASAGVVPAARKDGRVRPVLLSQEGPVILYERLAAIRAYDGWLDGQDVPVRRYHRCRIEVKRFRYVLEFLSDVTGPEGEPLVGSLKAVQDHLGEMREAWLTAYWLEREFFPGAARNRKPIPHPGVEAYVAARREDCDELRRTFPEVWAAVSNREFHRRIAAIAAAF